MRYALVLEIFISTANLLVDPRFFCLRRHFALEILASVRTVRGHPEECDRLIEPGAFYHFYL